MRALGLFMFFVSGQFEGIRLDGEVVPSGHGMWKWLGRQMVGTQGEERGWHLLSKQGPVMGAFGGWLCLSGSCCHIHSPLEVGVLSREVGAGWTGEVPPL